MKVDSFNQISHPMSYYMENLQKLKDKLRDLGDYREIIRRKVSEANGRGDEIEVNVLHWQLDADSLLDDIEQLIRESTTKDNICSTECPCPDITWQYKFCKQAEEKIADADELIIKYNNFNQISDKNYVNFDSRASIFKDIMDALKDSNVNMIGVFGLGGVGKTTLVKEVGEQMRKDGTFKQVAMSVVSKDLNVKEVQSKLADSLNFEFKAKADDQERRATELWNKFTNGDKYLIILDDIWEGVKMEAIGIPCTNEKKGCKVVLTSRNEDLLSTVMEVDRIFSIAILSSAEAWTLFMKKVGNSIQSQQEIQSVAYEVCKQCKGLPVAINALGEALKGKQEHAWKTALDKMDKYMLTKIVGINPSVLASLRVSFDMLPSPDAKSCFLLCCLFAEDAEIPIDELMRLCVARNLLDQNPNTLDKATNAVRTMVDTLKSASLLTTDGHETVVKIHNVIRDVGISIAREEEAFLVDHDALQWPRNPTNGPSYKAMSLSFKNNKRFPDGLVYQQLETLMVDNSELSDVEVPDNFFNGMMQLKVLTFTRMRMRQLPSSLAKLTNLQMLNLNRCELENIAILEDLKFNLEVLSLRGSRIEALPPQIGQLIGLRLLDLRDCYQLKVIPRGVISNLTRLEELYFPKNFDKWEAITDEQQDTSNRGNVSLEELRGLLSTGQLTTLHVYIPDVMLLPKEDLIFANLKGFKISVGSEIKTSEEISGRCKLKLEGIQLRNEFIPLVDKAEVVILSKIEGLKKVFHDRGVGNRFLDLKYLKLGEPKTSVQSHGLHRLRSFNNLTVLIIEYCKLKYLFSPTTARGLVHLEELKVGCCEIMEGIVGFEERNDEDEFTSEVKFSKLKQLELRDLPSLLSFYAQKDKIGTTMGRYSACAQPLFSEKVIFLVLERLTINKLGNIIKIWDKQSIAVLEEQGSFCQLTDLEVRRCNKLIHVFPSNMHPLLKNLIELEVKECETMKGIAEFEGEIDEDGLRNEVASSAREHLEMVGVTEIQDKQPLPKPRKEVESLCKPMDIRIVKCDQLLYVFPSHMLPLNLQQLWIENCDKLEVIFSKDLKEEKEAINDDNIVFPRLERVILWHLPKLKSFYTETQGFFSHKVSLPNLEVLHVSDLENLERLGHGPLSAGSLSKLKEFSVRCCGKLLCVFPSQFLPMLQELQELTVESCHSLDVVFQLEGLVPSNILPNLQKLYVKGCPTIESIVFKNGKEEAADHISLIIPRLRYLRISDMENLKSFYSSSTASNAQSLFNHQVILPVLEIFEVDRLGNIVEIWDKQSPWLNENTVSCSKLREMKVQRCKKLMNLVPSNILPRLQNLQNLCVDSCPKIESMVFKNEKEEEAADDSALIIPQLRYLRISDMENLKSFYSSSTASNAQSLFNHQVAFPALNILELKGCASLRYTFHPYIGVLVNLEEIIIKHCSEMRAVISKEIDKDEEVEDRQQRKTETTMFPNLSKLELHHLQELKLFCHYTHPLEFPLLRQMAICYCPRMDSFSLGHVRALDLSLKDITHKMGKMVKDGDDTTVTAQKNQEDVEPKNGGKKISGRISIEEV